MTNDGSTEPFDGPFGFAQGPELVEGLRAPSTVEGLAEVQFSMTKSQ